jgi:hypothetical protein
MTITAGAAIRFPITEVAETSADDSSDPYWIHVGSPHDLRLPFQRVTRVQQPVSAGTIVALQIMRPWEPAPAGHVTLRTALSN